MEKWQWDALKEINDFHLKHIKAGIEEQPDCQICQSCEPAGTPTEAGKEGE